MLFIDIDLNKRKAKKNFEDALIIAYLNQHGCCSGFYLRDTLHRDSKEMIADIASLSKKVKYAVFTIRVDNYRFVCNLLSELKNAVDAEIILKGYYATLNAEELLHDNPQVDCIVSGFSPHSFLQLEKSVDKSTVGDVDNIICRGAAAVTKRSSDVQWKDISNVSPILAGVYNFNDVLNYGLSFSFGCDNQCIYCYQNHYYHNQYFRDKETITEEMKYIKDQSKHTKAPVKIELLDTDFSKHPFLKDILRASNVHLGADVEFCGQIRIDQVSDDTIHLIGNSNVKYIAFGLESADESVVKNAKATNGKTSYVKIAQCNINKLKKYKKVIGANIILGLPFENAKSIASTIKFLQRNGIYDTTVNYLVVIKNTRLDKCYYNIKGSSHSLWYDNMDKVKTYNDIFIKLGLRNDNQYVFLYKKMVSQLYQDIMACDAIDVDDIYDRFVQKYIDKTEHELYDEIDNKVDALVIAKRGSFIKYFDPFYNFTITDKIQLIQLRKVNIAQMNTIYVVFRKKYKKVVFINLSFHRVKTIIAFKNRGEESFPLPGHKKNHVIPPRIINLVPINNG